jgi:hypothetical protein
MPSPFIGDKIMGYTNLYLTPKDPEFVPIIEDRVAAERFIEDWSGENCVDSGPSFKTSDCQMYFGSFPERLVCPACTTVLDVYDEELDEWAYDLQEHLYSSRDARNLRVTMPCCETEIRAQQLSLESDEKHSTARFGRFSIYIHDARDNAFSKDELAQLSSILKCGILQFTESGT